MEFINLLTKLRKLTLDTLSQQKVRPDLFKDADFFNCLNLLTNLMWKQTIKVDVTQFEKVTRIWRDIRQGLIKYLSHFEATAQTQATLACLRNPDLHFIVIKGLPSDKYYFINDAVTKELDDLAYNYQHALTPKTPKAPLPPIVTSLKLPPDEPEAPELGEIKPGKYATKFITKCNLCTGELWIRSGTTDKKFYVSSANKTAWKVLRLLVETTNKQGYVFLKEFVSPNWASAFTSSKRAKTPDGFTGYLDSKDLKKHILPQGRTGNFRLYPRA